MSRARFAVAIIAGAGITLSPIAATRLITYHASPAPHPGDHSLENAAYYFEQCLTFRQPIGPRHIASSAHPLEMIPCSGP
jgi:hypothetical protein